MYIGTLTDLSTSVSKLEQEILDVGTGTGIWAMYVHCDSHLLWKIHRTDSR